MACQDIGTVAALQYSARPALGFVDIVEEFDIAFQACAVNQRRLTWDCDDIAIFDQDTFRIALGWMQPRTPDGAWYLIIAVGRSPFAGTARVTRRMCEDLACRIIKRTGDYLPHDAVFRSDVSQPVDAGLIDAITERLASHADNAQTPPDTSARSETIQGSPARPKASSGFEPFRLRLPAAQGVSPIPSTDDSMGLMAENDDLRRLREALCGTTIETEITLPMHLSIYALGATMLLQAPPVGAALLVYTVLREEFGISLRCGSAA